MAVQVPNFERLFPKLNNTKTQTSNPSLWELLKELISLLIQFARSVAGVIDDATEELDAFKNRTYITVNNESAYFPFSRQMLAGAGIIFDDSITNERTVSATASGYDCPLTDGNVDETDLIFAAGECIIVQVPNP